jgi:predicted RNA-binding protein (virulence factor B family)
VDDKYFVKEIESYLFFPVPFSPWQLLTTEKELNEQVTFALENIEKKEKITASLFNNSYIPEFNTAVKFSKSKEVIEATVYKVSPHGIYLNVVGEKIQGKLPPSSSEDVKVGDKINIKIVHLSKTRIVVERA